LLNVTNAKVCANIVVGRSYLANASGKAIAEMRSCGRNARDSILNENVEDAFGAEER